MDDLRMTINYGLRMILFIILPAMAGLMLLREPIVHLFFEHGAFSAADTTATASVLLAYAVGLWAFAGVRILVSAFYSLQDTKTPALAAVAGVLSNLILALLLMKSFQYVGLAIATAIASMVNGSILLIILTQRLGGLHWNSLGKSIARIVLALVPVILASFWVAELAVWDREGEWGAKAFMLFVGIGFSVTGYLVTHALLRSEELDDSWITIKKKLRLA